MNRIRFASAGGAYALLTFAPVGRIVDVDLLVGAEEIARRLEVARPQVVYQWRRRLPDFPPPVFSLSRPSRESETLPTGLGGGRVSVQRPRTVRLPSGGWD